tara:strand:+ start:21 stop:620 length:600 start_codon:yes stop_codon:yes gene_type:complete
MAISLNGSTNVITGVAVGGLPDGIVDTDMLANGAVTATKRGAGAILQVKQTVKTDTASYSNTSFTKVTGFSSTITTTGSNKVLVRVMLHFGLDAGRAGQFRLARTTSGSSENDELIIGDASGNRTRASMGGLFTTLDWMNASESIEFLDSPSAGTHEYYIKARSHDSSYPVYINRNYRYYDGAYSSKLASVITTMEVSA